MPQLDKGVQWADGQRLAMVGDPIADTDAATKQYVDGLIAAAVQAHNELAVFVGEEDAAILVQVAAKADASHIHPIADIDGLEASLTAKSNVGHTHAQSEITSLVNDLAAKAASNHTHSGLPVMGRLNADVANSSNSSFSNLFTQAVLAGEVWSFEAILYVTTAAATTGIVTQVDSPSSPTASQVNTLSAETATVIRGLPASANSTMTGTAGLTTVLETKVTGTIEVGANAGNIVIKFRSEVNASAVTVKRGSWARFYKH